MQTRVAPSPPPADLRSEVVQRIASSVSFHRSPRLRELFLYICERAIQNRPEELREQQIGCGVFGRKPDYNPGEDNIVRVEVRQLRKRLEEYFATEGKDEPFVILIPNGSYVPVFQPPESIESLAAAASDALVKPPTWWFWAPLSVALLLAVVSISLWRENRNLSRRADAATPGPAPARPPLWPLVFDWTQHAF